MNVTRGYQYENIAARLIESIPALEYIKNSEVKIGFAASDAKKKDGGKTTCADCKKVPGLYKPFIPEGYDFMITVYEPNVEHMNPDQLDILILHELLHVGIEDDGMAPPRYFVKAHTFEEFEIIVRTFGTDWAGYFRTPGPVEAVAKE